MYEDADYRAIDATISAWAERHGFRVEKESKGFAVRSVWNGKLQVWIDAPDGEGFVRVYAAELRPDLQSKWGRRLEWRTTQKELGSSLDQVVSIGSTWS